MFRKLLLILCALVVSNAFAQVMINEFLYDTQGTDDPNIMYVEIYGPANTDLSGWSLVGLNGNGGAEYLTVPLDGTIPADGYYVVGGAGVANVDQIVTADFQNAGSSTGDDCDGIDLRNGSGGVEDHICYGPCASGHVCTGEGGSNAPDPFPAAGVNKAIARIPDHSDTDNNGTDFVGTETLTPGTANSGVPCEPLNTNLAAIRASDASGVPTLLGQFVVVTGVANVANYTLDSLTLSNFYMQDDDAGINVFRGVIPAGVVAGTELTISGWVSQFNGLTELVSSGAGSCIFSAVINNQGAAPSASILHCNSDFESFEGMLARIDNVTIVGGDPWPAAGSNANVDITDGTGTFTLRIDKDTQVDGTTQPQGAFSVTGIITQFDNSSPYTDSYQITVRYPTDIVTSAADEPHAIAGVSEFRLVDAYPNPFNSTARIRYEVGSARELTLSIVDILGREVLNQKLTNLTPGTHEFVWSPNSATGLYLARVSGESGVQSTKLLYLK
jgi:hypothetical protein